MVAAPITPGNLMDLLGRISKAVYAQYMYGNIHVSYYSYPNLSGPIQAVGSVASSEIFSVLIVVIVSLNGINWRISFVINLDIISPMQGQGQTKHIKVLN